MEPITIFSRIVDPAGVAEFLRDLTESGAKVGIKGPDDDWREAIVIFRDGKRTLSLKLTHDPEYYSEPNWSQQMDGMKGYFSRFPKTKRKARILQLPSTFRFSIGTIFEPDFDPDGDPRLDAVLAITRLLDGVIFTPSSMRDASGRILFSSGGEEDEDPKAVWPRVVGEVSASEPRGAAMHEKSRPKATAESDDDDDAEEAPTADRVARRALALAAVTARAMLEQDRKDSKAVETRKDLLAWIEDLDLRDEFEEEELATIKTPIGKLASESQVDSTWRLEGLTVLAWALNRFEIPPHDELVDPNRLWGKLGLLDVEAAQKLLANPKLKSRNDINSLRNRLFAIHWRLRNYHVSPGVMDFAEFAKTCWFGPLDIEGVPLVGGDLAIRGKRIDRASENAFSAAHSSAQERHQAANWLLSGPEQYSEASVAT